MREIVYLHLGPYSNYVGTHFWNTQESYLSESLESDEARAYGRINHETSFRSAGSSQDPTMCPRLLIFDYKENFGTLNRSNALGTTSTAVSEAVEGIWNGPMQEIRQPTIASSAYQKQLEAEGSGAPESVDEIELEEDVRYWSDFNRCFYTPDTIQPVPRPVAELNEGAGGWRIGQETFKRYEEQVELMDTAVRSTLEECDSVQGFQVLSDSGSWGGFTTGLLETFRDDYGRTSVLTVPFLSSPTPGTTGPDIDWSDVTLVKSVLSDALLIRALRELADLSVPVQPPTEWSSLPAVHQSNSYRSSAYISTHVESVTLPLRTGQETVSTLASRLTHQSSSAPFASLSGKAPWSSDAIQQQDWRLDAFTLPSRSRQTLPIPDRLSQLDVTRGLNTGDIKLYDASYSKLNEGRGLKAGQVVRSYYAHACPLPSSFPRSLYPTSSTIEAPESTLGNPSVSGISSLCTSEDLALLFKNYAQFSEQALKTRLPAVFGGVGGAVGMIDLDEMREVVQDLWGLVDALGGGDGGGED